MNIIERIRAEIERRMETCDANSKTPDQLLWAELGALIAFLDTLEEPVSENLEEAAMNYIAPIENEDGLKVINFSGQDIKDAFIAGSEWRYQKDRAEFAKLKAKEWMSGYDEGLSKGKEQMMKDAEECGLYWDGYFLAIDLNMTALGYSERDKVRIIIVKEDGE